MKYQSDKEAYENIMCMFIHQTDKAVLIEPENNKSELWIPKSLLSHSEHEMDGWQKGDMINLRVATWFIDKNDLT